MTELNEEDYGLPPFFEAHPELIVGCDANTIRRLAGLPEINPMVEDRSVILQRKIDTAINMMEEHYISAALEYLTVVNTRHELLKQNPYSTVEMKNIENKALRLGEEQIAIWELKEQVKSILRGE